MATKKTAGKAPGRKLNPQKAASTATNRDKVAKPGEKSARDLRNEFPRAFQMGQQAKAACIPENQMPVLSDKEREAYLLGRNG